jgi:hypothetical protein
MEKAKMELSPARPGSYYDYQALRVLKRKT